jgi:hypothetical protein
MNIDWHFGPNIATRQPVLGAMPALVTGPEYTYEGINKLSQSLVEIRSELGSTLP